MKRLRWVSLLLTITCLAAPAAAQDREVPYWATLRSGEVYMRVGPSEDFPIEWVYRRQGLPVKVVRLNEGWRLVEDPDGERGWIISGRLDAKRGAIVTGDGLAEMRASAEPGAKLLWRVEPGVVGALGDCENDWCRFEVSGNRGWIEADRIWGDGDP